MAYENSLLSIANSIEPALAVRENSIRKIKSLVTQNTAPKAAEICQSTTLLLLLLLNQRYQLSTYDLYDLWFSLVSQDDHFRVLPTHSKCNVTLKLFVDLASNFGYPLSRASSLGLKDFAVASHDHA